MPIRLMFAGFGRTAVEHHLPFLLNNPAYALAAVYAPSEGTRAMAAKTYGVKTYADYQDALAAPDVDLVIILTPNNLHATMATDFLRAGKNVLVTKPWACNAAEAELVIRAARESGKQAFPWLPCRWSSDLRSLREIVASGIIGEVFMVRRCFSSFGKRCDWQTQRAFGGGYLLNWGPHLIDQPMQLVGERISSVYGVTKRVINPGDAEDMFLAVLTTQTGKTLIAEYTVCTDANCDWVVQGTGGTITVKNDVMQVSVVSQPAVIDPLKYRNDVTVETHTVASYAPAHKYGDHSEVYRNIADALNGRDAYRVSLESAYALTRVLDAVRQSAETGQVVSL